MNRVLGNFKLLGVIFIALLMLGVWLTYAVFTKQFAEYDEVTLQTSNVGLQLPERADVKVRGVIVGEVLDFEPTDEGADVTLGFYPEKLDQAKIPANVTGTIVPKTLFGEKYVSLVIPDDPSGLLAAEDTIEKTVLSTEVEQVLNDLYPLLIAVEPTQLNVTLNALVKALEGRGDQLGENLETLDAYLKRFNPEIPALLEDLRLASEVSDIYTDILPEVATILDNTVTTTQTLESREQRLNQLFGDITGFANTFRTFLAQNETNLVRSAELSERMLRVFSRYSPQFPCLTGGLVNGGKLQAEAFRGFTLHIILETLPRQPRAYDADDKPRLGEDRGPACLNLPNPPWNGERWVERQPDFNDGVDRTTGKGTSRAPTGYAFRDGSGFLSSEGEHELYRQLLAPSLGVSADEVGDLGPLLVGPMARGAEVSLR